VDDYLRAAMARPTAEHRVAAILPLLSGLSSGELRHLTAGQVDVQGRTIWVSDEDQEGWHVKTADRRRSLPLPAGLEDDVAELLVGRAPEDLLFHQADSGSPGKPRNKTWLRRLVRSVCEAAGVRVVCPHGLRGTYATMLVALQRRELADVGIALGHADAGRTAARHYVGAEPQRPALRVVKGGAR